MLLLSGFTIYPAMGDVSLYDASVGLLYICKSSMGAAVGARQTTQIFTDSLQFVQ